MTLDIVDAQNAARAGIPELAWIIADIDAKLPPRSPIIRYHVEFMYQNNFQETAAELYQYGVEHLSIIPDPYLDSITGFDAFVSDTPPVEPEPVVGDGGSIVDIPPVQEPTQSTATLEPPLMGGDMLDPGTFTERPIIPFSDVNDVQHAKQLADDGNVVIISKLGDRLAYDFDRNGYTIQFSTGTIAFYPSFPEQAVTNAMDIEGAWSVIQELESVEPPEFGEVWHPTAPVTLTQWTPEQLRTINSVGLQANAVPTGTTDILMFTVGKHKVAVWDSITTAAENIQKKVQEEIRLENPTAEVLHVTITRVPGVSWWSNRDFYNVYVFVRSPLAVAIGVIGAVIVALISATVIYTVHVNLKIAQLQEEVWTNTSELAQTILDDDTLTQEEKEEMLEQLFAAHGETVQGITDAAQAGDGLLGGILGGAGIGMIVILIIIMSMRGGKK